MHNFYSRQPQYYEIATIRTKRKQENYLKRLGVFLIFGLIGVSFYLWQNHSELVSSEKVTLSLGILWVSFLPSIQYLLDRNRPPMPFFPLVGIFYVNSFALPMFSSEKLGIGRWSQEYVTTESLELTLLGVLGMTIAFYASKFLVWKSVSPAKLPTLHSLTQLIKPLTVLVFLHGVFSYVIKLPSIEQITDPIGNVAYGMFYIIWSRGQLSSPAIKLFVGISFLFRLLVAFSSGSLANVGSILIFICIVIFYEKKRLPIFLISFLLTFFLVFNVVKGEYRKLIWYDGAYSQAGVIEKVQLFIDIAIKHYSNPETQSGKQGETQSSSASALSRTAHIILFSNVIKDTPRLVPYWNGESYSALFTKFIPRILWPDKPTDTVGNTFGRRYKYIGIKDYSTTFNLPWIVEMYANFGNSGVLIGMPLVGFVFAFLEQKLNSPRMGYLEVVIAVATLYGLTSHECNLSLTAGNIFNLALFLYIMFRFILRQKQGKSQFG